MIWISKNFCKALFLYRYVQNECYLTDSMVEWLYEHSGGITSVVVSLIHDAQEIAILSGKETLSIEVFNEAYKQRMNSNIVSQVHRYSYSKSTQMLEC